MEGVLLYDNAKDVTKCDLQALWITNSPSRVLAKDREAHHPAVPIDFRWRGTKVSGKRGFQIKVDSTYSCYDGLSRS